ncbi:MAG: hypothetical protein ACI9HK_000390, partial [Pirellulaceae bacterium]
MRYERRDRDIERLVNESEKYRSIRRMLLRGGD